MEPYQPVSPTANKATAAFPSTMNGPVVSEAPPEPVHLCLATAAESGVEDQTVPDTISLVKSFGFLKSYPSRPHTRVVGQCTVEMANHRRSINAEEKQAVFNVLKSFNSLGTFSAEMAKKLSIRSILLNILGETGFAARPYEYPEPLQRSASILLNRLDTELGAEQALEQSKPSPEPEASRAPKRQRKSKSETPSSELSRLSVEDTDFKHIMHGILISGESRRTYKLDPNYHTAPRNYRVFGHNGLEVGDWWPLQLCALRDGAHGSAQGGIAGSATTGAYSIIVSNNYAELDHDLGHTLYYSGSNSHSNTDPTIPHISNATKAMRVSFVHRRLLRVLRSGKADGMYAPSKGLRYDGLYMIESEAQEKNLKGGAYIRFKLVRCPGQKDIDVSRPNMKERRVFDALKEGVGW